MKAVVCTQYGSPDVLQLQEVPKPTPKEDEVLIKVHAASANAMDLHFLGGKPFMRLMFGGLFKPKHPILGGDVAGTVAAVGKNVKQFQPGDEVFGEMSNDGLGAFAEYACAKENSITHKPANVTFEQAAALPIAAQTAIQGLRDYAQIQSGQKVLVNGAGGGVGSFAVQIAKAYGCEVTGVCRTDKVEMVRAMGADHVIDYKQEDFTQRGEQYDVIFDVAFSRPFAQCKLALKPKSHYILAGGSINYIFQLLLLKPFITDKNGKQFHSLIAKLSQQDLRQLGELVANQQITPVIDSCYPLNQVADAIRHLESGNVKGKVVISVA